MTTTDRFGNPLEEGFPYARGEILKNTEDDYREVEVAWRRIRDRLGEHGRSSVYNFTGLERGFPAKIGDLQGMDDEIAPAKYGSAFNQLALDHMGGDPATHDVFLANRMTGATTSTALTLVDPGDTVIGVSPSHSHASVGRAVRLAGGRFIDTSTTTEFTEAVENEPDPALVVITRLASTYEILDQADLEKITAEANQRGIATYLDDAGGARVGPTIFDHPKSLQLEVTVAATGLDKYGVYGPRFGLLGGDKTVVSEIRATAWQLGLEARPVFTVPALRTLERYDPEAIRKAIDATKQLGEELDRVLDGHVHETPVIVALLSEDILELAMERGEIETPPIVPYEATAALAMLLLRDHGIITIHFAGIPSGTADLLLKFIPPGRLNRFGGASAFATAVDECITELSQLLETPAAIESLLLQQ